MDAMTPPETAGREAVVRPQPGLWALWGVGAGLLGIVATLLTEGARSLTPAEYLRGAEVIGLLDRSLYHIGVIAGFFAVTCLLFTAAGWRRWAERAAPASLPARVVSMAMVASAGALILGYGFKGSMAVYLDGGMDAGSMPREGLYVIFMFLDLGPYMAWWGAAIAAAVMAWLALRDRLLPLWIGLVSALFAIVPIGFLVLTGLPGFPGVVDPLWLAIVSLGMLFSRRTAIA
jgi:hypothetical protein